MFSPRHALTEHLKKLVDDGTLRGVAQATDLVEFLDTGRGVNHAFVYIVEEKASGIKAQARQAIKKTKSLTVVLAWQNNQPMRSDHGHGMDGSEEAIDLIEWHVHAYSATTDAYESTTTASNVFKLVDPSGEPFYRPQGWAFYPITFNITVTSKRTI